MRERERERMCEGERGSKERKWKDETIRLTERERDREREKKEKEKKVALENGGMHLLLPPPQQVVRSVIMCIHTLISTPHAYTHTKDS